MRTFFLPVFIAAVLHCTIASAEVCPLFKVGTYGSMELWYAQHCPGTPPPPQFTTIVLPAGAQSGSCGTSSSWCISGSPANLTNRFHTDLKQNGYSHNHGMPGTPNPKLNASDSFVFATDVDGTIEEFYVEYGDKPNGGNNKTRLAKIQRIRLTGNPQPGFVAIVAAEIDTGSTIPPGKKRLTGELLEFSASGNDKRYARIAVEITESDQIVANVIHHKN